MTARPPRWKARNLRERRVMVEWMFAKLDGHFARELNRASRYNGDVRELLRCARLQSAVEAARSGDVAPLRNLHPEIAEFIHPPKLGRGEKYPRRPEFDRVRAAKVAVPIVQAIWRQYYDGRWKRRRDDGPSAAEIAAQYYGVTVDAVNKKPSGRRRKVLRAK
jgi:hypothetical protein